VLLVGQGVNKHTSFLCIVSPFIHWPVNHQQQSLNTKWNGRQYRLFHPHTQTSFFVRQKREKNSLVPPDKTCLTRTHCRTDHALHRDSLYNKKQNLQVGCSEQTSMKKQQILESRDTLDQVSRNWPGPNFKIGEF
jgi:hypothetical protein